MPTGLLPLLIVTPIFIIGMVVLIYVVEKRARDNKKWYARCGNWVGDNPFVW